MRRNLIFFLLIIKCLPLYSQTVDSTVYIINNVDFNLTGRTRPFAILHHTQIKIGEEITGQANLEKYMEDKTQILLNQRVLETSTLIYTIGDIREDGKYPVNITITADDTWNVIALPYPKYDSNTGFELTIKARDYNFFGTMYPLRVDLGYREDKEGKIYFNLMTDNDFLFSALNLTWQLTLYNFFEYSPNLSEPFHYQNSIKISAYIPVSFMTLTLGFKESFFINEQNSIDNRIIYGLPDVQKGLYLSSQPFASLNIPTDLEIGKYGILTYTPQVSATFNHELPQWPLDITRKGPYLGFNHSLGFGRINWKGNFRDGFSASITNSYNYDFYMNKIDKDAFTYSIIAETIVHKAYADHFSLSLRAMYRQWFNTENTSAGDALRGILDRNIAADIMFSINTNITVGAMSFRPSKWFNKSKLRIFDFDLHLSPFIDTAVFRSREIELLYSGADFTYKNLLVTSGLEVLIFPSFFKSLHLRASLGLNFSSLSGLSGKEIFIGTELYY
jgi:hypothetical protein